MRALLKYLSPLLFLLALPSAADAATIHVNGATGANTVTCGTAVEPCDTIQYGAGRAQGLASADQIVVSPGTYPEIVLLDGANDTLVGAGSCTAPATCTVISPPSAMNTYVVQIGLNGDGATVSNVRIVASSAGNRLGIAAAGDNPTIRDVSVDMNAPASGNPAVRIDSAGTALVQRVDIDSDAVGEALYAGTLTSFTLVDSTVRSESARRSTWPWRGPP